MKILSRLLRRLPREVYIAHQEGRLLCRLVSRKKFALLVVPGEGYALATPDAVRRHLVDPYEIATATTHECHLAIDGGDFTEEEKRIHHAVVDGCATEAQIRALGALGSEEVTR